MIYVKYYQWRYIVDHLIVSLVYVLAPFECCLAAAVYLSSMLSIRGTRHAVPTVSRGSTNLYTVDWYQILYIY